jgi:hypothetical protein
LGFHYTKSNSTVGFPQTPFVRSFFPISERRRKKEEKKKKSEIGAKTGLKKKFAPLFSLSNDYLFI